MLKVIIFAVTTVNFLLSPANAVTDEIKKVWPEVLTSTVAIHKPGASFKKPAHETLNGTGFIVENSDEGIYIITNHHVIESTLASNSEVKKNPHMIIEFLRKDLDMQKGYVVGYAQAADIALLRVDLKELGQEKRLKTLKALSLGNSDTLKFGDDLLALGHPLANKNTPTFPIFTGQGFFVEDKVSVLRINGDLGPGNSGGPLFNNKGEVIGVNTAILPSPAQGVGFAVPSNVVKNLILPQLRNNAGKPQDRMKYSTLDISLQPLDGELMRFLRLPTRSGAIVTRVSKEAPGFFKGAGLRQGDIVVAVNGHSYDDNPLRGINGLTLFAPGESLTYDIIPDQVIRNDEAESASAIWRLSFFPDHKTLKEIHSEGEQREDRTPSLSGDSLNLLGFYLDQAPEGVYITRDLHEENKSIGFFIREVVVRQKDTDKLTFNKITALTEIKQILDQHKPKQVLLILSKNFEYNEFSSLKYVMVKVPY